MLRRRCFTENSKLSETVCSRMQCLSRPQSDAQPPPRPTSPTQTPSTTQRRLSWHPNAGRYGELWVSPPGKQCRLYRMIQISIQIWRPWPLTFLLSLCAFSDCVGVFLRNTNFMNSNASCFNWNRKMFRARKKLLSERMLFGRSLNILKSGAAEEELRCIIYVSKKQWTVSVSVKSSTLAMREVQPKTSAMWHRQNFGQLAFFMVLLPVEPPPPVHDWTTKQSSWSEARLNPSEVSK